MPSFGVSTVSPKNSSSFNMLCVGGPPGGFCDVGCGSSFIVFFVMLVVVAFTFPGYFSMPPALHYGFSGS